MDFKELYNQTRVEELPVKITYDEPLEQRNTAESDESQEAIVIK